MLLVSDVHGAYGALGRIAARGEPLLVLGDLLNLVDYRTMEGILVDAFGRELVSDVAALRERGDFAAARARWRSASGNEDSIRTRFRYLVRAAYRQMRAALEGADAYVTFGNADQPELLREMLPEGCRYVDGEAVEIEGVRVGFAGGGVGRAEEGPGVLSEQQMAEKLTAIGPADVLCTHVPPAVPQLSTDVVAGWGKRSEAISDYLAVHRPRWHYFGDIHQPQATHWRVGTTRCRNVGYFRATGRAVRHG
jgi:Icc-related predicted phosphoesterase